MAYIALGILGFTIIHLSDIVSLKRIPFAKPITWLVGGGLLVYSVVMVSLISDRLPLPGWSLWLGWLLLAASILLLVYSLFFNLPFGKTYVSRGVGSRLVENGLYALVRHPGVWGFVLVMLSLVLVSGSSLMLVAAPVWIFLDILLVVVQDKFFFGKMFPGYEDYRRKTPMLFPNRRSLAAFLGQARRDNLKLRRSERMSVDAEMFKRGDYDELWQRCCGFIDLSLKDFMRIQKRLLMEQMGMLKKCQLGQEIMGGISPRSVEEFRQQVPLTDYADYSPYLLKRRMDVLPKKPILWQCTSGKSGEYPLMWAPVTARQLDEIEPLLFALLLFSSCNKRGDIGFKEKDKFLYGMAPPPYTSGTMARIFPNELFDLLPSIEEAEKMSFEDRIHQGFELALSEGLDLCFALSSVTVAIGERFRQRNGSSVDVRTILKKPKSMLRLAKALARSKLARRPMLPKDLWALKGLVTFGMDGSVYREKIKRMWGRYPLDFHGCTEAVIIAMQTWDYQDMTFVPHLNFFEFIPEEESIKSREDTTYQPSTLLLDQVKPGRYELVITNFHGGPFARYRPGHLIEITSLRNEKLGIDIPQMTFVCRIDDQIDIAGFTRLSEKAIWQAIENTELSYKGWMARKEVKEKPALNLYLELGENEYVTARQVADMVHEELKKLDTPYAELESFTGLRPLEVTLLPENAFATFVLRQKAAGADLVHLKPPHINPSDATVKFMVTTTREVTARFEQKVEA